MEKFAQAVDGMGASPGYSWDWTERDAVTYALGVGCGVCNDDPRDFCFLREDDVRILPSFATVAARQAAMTRDGVTQDQSGTMLLGQSLTLYRPLKPAGRLIAHKGLTGIYDRAPRRGALLVSRTSLTDEAGALLATVESRAVAFAREGSGNPPAVEAEHPPPLRPPDRSVLLRTFPNQALIFSLCGDRNPLHINPDAARRLGFPGPVLHGLCTFGFSCRALAYAFCEAETERIRFHEADFCAPVFPGDTLRVDFWQDAGVIVFEAFAVERDVRVVRNGKSMVRSA